MRVLLALAMLIGTVQVFAADFESLDDIRTAALTVAGHGSLMPGSSAEATLDANLRLPACGQPLQTQSAQRNVVEVACAAPTMWKIYVPVRITRAQDVLVLSHAISGGQPIGADAFVTEKRDVTSLVGSAISDPQQAIGRIAARTLVAGTPLLETDLVAPRVVKRGEAVTIVVHTGGIDVRAPGLAMNEAGLNERVNVENVGSHRVVQGVVRAGGEVDVAL